jgi:hypothetical protein
MSDSRISILYADRPISRYVITPPHPPISLLNLVLRKVYAGTPLTTKRGINIGSLYILDDKPRDSIRSDQIEFLGTMASAIMTYLETQREAAVGRRMSRFNQGLNCFVEGRNTMSSPLDTAESSPLHSGEDQDGDLSPQITTSNSARSRTLDQPPPRYSPVFQSTPPIPERLDLLAPGHPVTFARAANLLRESLDLDKDGGVVFYDANNGMIRGQKLNRRGSVLIEETDSAGDASEEFGQPLTNCFSGSTTFNSFNPSENRFKTPKNPAKTLALSTSANPMLMEDAINDSLRRLDDSFLQNLLNLYPKGKMWVFDESGSLSSAEDDPLSNQDSTPRQSKRSRQKQLEASILLRHFPGVRQLLFTPLWDAALSQWFSGCFCWNTVESQVFTADVELTFLSNFGKAVMAECSRLDTILADQQKGDFIGSVSYVTPATFK